MVMADREKVIEGFDICLKNIESPDCPSNCPYFNDCSKYENRVVFQPLMRDALAMLKEQEPMQVISQRPYHYGRKGFCPKCHQVVEWYLNRQYCGFCGQAVKWNENRTI